MPQVGDHVVVEWDAPTEYTGPSGTVEPIRGDIAYYEVRRGINWTFGRRVICTPCTSFRTRDWVVGTETYFVRARLTNGRYTKPASVSITTATPGNHRAEADRDETTAGGGWAGAHSDTTTSGTSLVLAAGKTTGSYVSPEIDMGTNDTWRIGTLFHADCENRSQTWEGVKWTALAGKSWDDMRSDYGGWDYRGWDGPNILELDWNGNNFYHPTTSFVLEYTVYDTSGVPGSLARAAPGEYEGRYLQFNVTLTRESTTDETPAVSACTTTWSIPPAHDRDTSFITTGQLGLAHGGTSADLSAVAASNLLRMNAGQTALESTGLTCLVDTAAYNAITNIDGESISVGDATVGALCGMSTIVGVGAGASNTGSAITAFGAGACDGNSGISVTALGIDAAKNNTGWLVTCIGSNAGKDSTGLVADPQYLTVVGGNAGRHNHGTFATGMGGYSLYGNRGDHPAAFGWRSDRQNLGDRTACIGLRSLENNAGDYNSALGSWSFRTFTNGTEETFDNGDITVGPPSQITIVGHGFGAPGTYVHLRYEEGTSGIPIDGGDLPGADDGSHDDIYVFYVVNANTLQFDTVELTGAGAGAGHKLYPRSHAAYSNSTALGYQAEPDASNQCMVGNASLTEIKSAGLLNLTNVGANQIAGSLNVDTINEYSAGVGVTVDTVLIKDGSVDGVDVSAHAADGTIHFVEGSIDHTAITNIGATSHASIDTHIGASTGVHGVGASTVASEANIATHAALDTGVHGAGASTLATAADIATHAAVSVNVHGLGAGISVAGYSGAPVTGNFAAFDAADMLVDSGSTAATFATAGHTHDDRYYTETELNGGQLDTRYYTETELDGGILDTLYYTEGEVDTLLATYLPLAGGSMLGNIDMGGHDIQGVAVLNADTIDERTPDAGVTIEAVSIKDGLVDSVDVGAIPTTYLPLSGGAVTGDTSFATNISVDTIHEKTATVGVTIDSVKCWDGGIYFKDIVNDKLVYLYASTVNNYILRLPEAAEGEDMQIVTWSQDSAEVAIDGADFVGDVDFTGDVAVSGLLTAGDNLTCDAVNHRTYLGLYTGGTPGAGSEGTHCSFFGEYAGYQNNQNYVAAFGYYAGRENTGLCQSAFGFYAGYLNTGTYQSAFGMYAGRSNTGLYQSAFGFYAGHLNTGSSQSAFGMYAGRSNTGLYQSAFGFYAGQYNDGDNNTAIGYVAFNAFPLDAGSAVSFDFGDVDVANDRVTCTTHGLGANDTYRNLKFTQGTAELPGIDNNGIDIWKIVDANTLECITDTITAQGTGTGHTLTPQYVYSNSTAIGYDAEPDASNQIVLGDTNVTQIKSTGLLKLTNAGTNEIDGDLGVGGDFDVTGEATFTGDVSLFGVGANHGEIRIYDTTDVTYTILTTQGGTGYICTEGTAPDDLALQDTAHANVKMFHNAAEGETCELRIYGYRTGDALRSLQIGVGTDAADTASFDGVSAYWFDGNVEAAGEIEAATAHIGGATHYAAIAADGELSLHGTARVTRSAWISATGLKAPGTKPAVWVDHGISGAWQFSDATDDTIVANIQVPVDMDRTVAPVFVIGWSSTETDNECVWQLEYLWTALNEDTTAAAQETLNSTDAASATAEGLVISEITGIDLPSATDACLHVRVKRLGADGGDVLTADVELHGICLQYTANKLGTAT